MKHNQNVPLWEKYTLTVEEAAAYFRIGEHKLRRLINENKNADYLLWNGNRVQIKRVKFEKYVDTLEAIQKKVSVLKKSKIYCLKFWQKAEYCRKNEGAVIY